MLDDGISDLVHGVRIASLRDRLAGQGHAEESQPTNNGRPHESEQQHSPVNQSDAEVRTNAVQEAVEAGVIPDTKAARERYGQGITRKRNAIRDAVHQAANSEGYSDQDVQVFQPFFNRLMTARTRQEAADIIGEAIPLVSHKAAQALGRHVGSEFAARVWNKK
jgi:signal recognition particle GTPase